MSQQKLRTDMKTPGTNYLLLRLAMLILPLAPLDRSTARPLDRAPAANNCNATSPADNTTVTGATSDANGTTGYGTNTDNGNTYNILSGAPAAGTGIGLRFSNNGTVNNFGTIAGAGAVTFDCGILGGTGPVNNAGVISATGGW
jgi:hypothetical protein